MKPLVDALSGIRVYSSYWLHQVQRDEQLVRLGEAVGTGYLSARSPIETSRWVTLPWAVMRRLLAV